MAEEKLCKVKSRNGGNVFYQIPEDRILRQFTNEEVKLISLDELQKLQFLDGGEYIIKNCLIVEEEALKELNIEVEPEYFYTKKEVLNILENGTLDQLEDTLNFAPSGVIDIIKQQGVAIELPDTRKRKLIFEKTGFNIDGALAVNEALKDDDAPTEETSAPTRKAAKPVTENSSGPVRKAAAPKKYKVIE